MIPHTAPSLNKSAFNCPHCEAFSSHSWFQSMLFHPERGYLKMPGWAISRCQHCGEFTIWLSDQMVYPDAFLAPPANHDLPPDIRADYAEAASIIQRSSRGAAALFRLFLQKLCVVLGEPGKNLNTDIASLVRKGLSPKVQQSLDAIRVLGNEAVHPGTIDLRDKPETAVQLAKLINFIADAMITHPKQIDAIYDSLPESKKSEIKKRDEPPKN